MTGLLLVWYMNLLLCVKTPHKKNNTLHKKDEKS